jgi:hypothetical protein
VWKIYLYSLIISLFFITPYFVFVYTTDKITKVDIKCLKNEIEFVLSFFLFVIPANATAVVAVVFVTDLCVADYKNKNKRYLRFVI